MILRNLKEYCEDYCEKFPSFKDQIWGILRFSSNGS